MVRFSLVAACLALLAAGCSGGTSSLSASNLCPTPSTFCEGNTLVHCSTLTSGVIPEPSFSRTDCGSNRVCVPEPNGARCR